MPGNNYPIKDDFLAKFQRVLARLTALEARNALSPVQQGNDQTTGTTTSHTPADLSGTSPGPSCPTTTIGPSGSCNVQINALINVPAGEAGVIDLYVDGVDLVPGAVFLSPGPLLVSVCQTLLLEGLAQGTHNFTLKYWMSGSSAVSFSSRLLIVEPL